MHERGVYFGVFFAHNRAVFFGALLQKNACQFRRFLLRSSSVLSRYGLNSRARAHISYALWLWLGLVKLHATQSARSCA